ncbi:hypothetical protein APHAL10511_002384 [Amanita phalloides]|nr:hypothetical protein APHAL10511_002384 [Amanita phalloides]
MDPTAVSEVTTESESEEIYRIADNTQEVSISEDLCAMATPRKKRPPVYRLPTSNKNTPKRFLLTPQAPKGTPDESPLSEPESTLPSLPSISRLCSESEDNLLNTSISSLLSTPRTPSRILMCSAESMTIDEMLQQSMLDNADLLGETFLESNDASASINDLFGE